MQKKFEQIYQKLENLNLKESEDIKQTEIHSLINKLDFLPKAVKSKKTGIT